MVEKEKNPYDSGTPEWQLYENMKSHELCASAAAADAERALEKGRNARERADLYRDALAKLTMPANDGIEPARPE